MKLGALELCCAFSLLPRRVGDEAVVVGEGCGNKWLVACLVLILFLKIGWTGGVSVFEACITNRVLSLYHLVA